MYFNARTSDESPVYVELPPEDLDHGGDLCGKLNVHMYGTRPAADGWHCEYASTLKEGGFRVQDDFGWTVYDYSPSSDEIAFALKVFKACDSMPLYGGLILFGIWKRIFICQN